MKKYLALIIISITVILSCEKDDICIEETTPNLIIRFYNKDTITQKKLVKSLTVWIDGRDSIYTKQSIDSIVIPLDLNKDNTLYKFRSDTIIDKINFTYNRKDIFVSRSCGYKTIFENLQIESDSINWIKNIDIINSTIENDTTAHINIFH